VTRIIEATIFQGASGGATSIGAQPPADALKRLPKVERKPITALTVEQSQRLLTAIKHTAIYWPVMLPGLTVSPSSPPA
jgi:hypothetical protein